MVRRSAPFAGKTAIITGGASGIGLALGAELVAQHARVVLADIDAVAVGRKADELAASAGASASIVGRQLDVRDRDGVRSLVDEIAGRDGSIDLLFNNAGLAMGGPTHELAGQHWDRIIDVNIGGVVNGVLAAYPRMIEQGHGHIVNTASAAGLAAPPLVVPYASTKHAVVGLSTGLRPEAALHGVRVSVLCPGAVETAILDQLPSPDLPATASVPVTARQYLQTMRQKPMPADRFARAALRAIARNKAINRRAPQHEGTVAPPPPVAGSGRADQPIDGSDRHPRTGPARIARITQRALPHLEPPQRIHAVRCALELFRSWRSVAAFCAAD